MALPIPTVEYETVDHAIDPELCFSISLLAPLFSFSIIVFLVRRRMNLYANNVVSTPSPSPTESSPSVYKSPREMIFLQKVLSIYSLLLSLVLFSIPLIVTYGVWRRGYGTSPSSPLIIPSLPTTPGDFTLIFLSDPQIAWGRQDDTTLSHSEFISTGVETNRYHVAAINQLVATIEYFRILVGIPINIPLGAMISGDLTAYGREWEWSIFSRLYIRTTPHPFPNPLTLNIWPGLGNHDYANNAGSCWGPWESIFTYRSSWCAANSLLYIEKFVKTNKHLVVSYDLQSRAYSWVIRGIRFIQLHYNPGYENSEIGVQKSYSWLEEEMEKAIALSQPIIIGLHDIHFRDTEIEREMARMRSIGNATIIAFFVGHVHENIGLMDERIKLPSGRNISIIYGGSASYNKFIVANFYSPPAHHVDLWPVDSIDGIPRIDKNRMWRIEY